MPKQSKKIIQTSRGMKDILPEESLLWFKVRDVVEKTAKNYGFSWIETPILEPRDLFVRGTGVYSEIVQKQMFVLRTKKKESLALRPEATPSIVRAYIQEGMASWPQPVKLFYSGPMFRYERPQQGREREFHQFGFEIIGSNEPVYDALLISIFYQILKELKIKRIIVKVNSIGCRNCRRSYIRALKRYYRPRLNLVCRDCQRRFKENPLRMLDCKNPKCQKVKKDAPNILDYLCSDCKSHFKEVLESLEGLGVPYVIEPNLVRGLDYYSNTVFEIFACDVEEETDSGIALVGGGRYNYLVKELGGKPTPAAGGAAGIERIINALEEGKVSFSKKTVPLTIFVVQLGRLAKKKALIVFENLVKEGFRVKEAFGKDSLKAQLRIADREGARFALIIGQREVFEGTAILKDMESGVQEEVAIEDISARIKRKARKIKSL